MSKFNIGDRVIVTQNCSMLNYRDLKGLHGTIVDIRDSSVPYIVALDDRQHPANTNGMYYFDDNEIAFEGCYYATVDCSLSNNGKENGMNILDVYFENEQEKNDKNFEKMKEKTMRKDLVYKEVMDLKNKYKDVDGVEINISTRNYNPSDAVIKELHKLYDKRDARDKELRELEKEIKAQIELCETYEQKQNILKAYGVIDEQGKLIK